VFHNPFAANCSTAFNAEHKAQQFVKAHSNACQIWIWDKLNISLISISFDKRQLNIPDWADLQVPWNLWIWLVSENDQPADQQEHQICLRDIPDWANLQVSWNLWIWLVSQPADQQVLWNLSTPIN